LAAVALLSALGGFTFAAFAQATAAGKPATPKKPVGGTPAKPAVQWRRECLKEADFCVQVPAAWKSMGSVFDGAGFMVAEPDPQKAPENLNQITVAFIDMPQEGDKPRPTASELVDIVLGSPAEGTTQETTQRSRVLVAGIPTEIVKIRLHTATGDWVEEVALLDTDETVYAIALACAPQDVARLEPVFRHVMESWSPVPLPGNAPPRNP
jgi:hypothetical protein